jgi:hypothetical protein
VGLDKPLLVPLVFTTLLVPSAVRWMSGNAAERAREAATAHSAGDISAKVP